MAAQPVTFYRPGAKPGMHKIPSKCGQGSTGGTRCTRLNSSLTSKVDEFAAFKMREPCFRTAKGLSGFAQEGQAKL